MEAIEAYNTDSDESSDKQSSLAAEEIKIVEGSSKSLKPSDFFGLENGEESDDPPNKKIKTEENERKPIMVQGSAVEVPSSDFWKDVTHKQIVFINNSLGSNSLTKSGSHYLTGNGSEGLFSSTSVSNDETKIVRFVQTSSAQEVPVLSTVSKPENTMQTKITNTSATAESVYSIPLTTPVHFVSVKQASSLNALNIIPSTPTIQSVSSVTLNSAPVPSTGSSQIVFNTPTSPQAVQNLAMNAIKMQPLNNSQSTPQAMQNLAVNAVKIQPLNNSQACPQVVQNLAKNAFKIQPFKYSQTVLGLTPSTQTEKINISSTSAANTTLRAMLNRQSSSTSVSSNMKSQSSNMISTQVASSSSSSFLDNCVKTDLLKQVSPHQTFLLPAIGDQPAKLIQLFPADSTIGKNLAAALPTSAAQASIIPVVQNNIMAGKLDPKNLLQSGSSLVPVIKLTAVSQQGALSVPTSQNTQVLQNKVQSKSEELSCQQLQNTSEIAEKKRKSASKEPKKQQKSELLRLLQSPLITSPVSLQTSTLTPKYTEADLTNKIHSTVNGTSVEKSQVSDSSLKKAKPSRIEKDKPLSECVNNSLTEPVISRKELLKIHDKILCLLNKPIIKKKPPTRLERSFFAHGVSVNRIKWSCHRYSHLLLSASMDGTVKVFSGLSCADSKMVLQVNAHHAKAVKDAEWSADGNSILSCSYDQTALITDVETGKTISKLCHNTYVSCGKFHPILGKNVITGSKNIIEAWDIRTPEKPVRVFKYKDRMGQIQDIIFDKDGQQVFSASGIVSRDSADRNIMAWDYSTGAVLSNQIFQERYSCTRLKLHPTQNLFLSQTQGGYIAIFSTKRPYEMVWSKRYEGHKMEGHDIGFDISSDGSVVVSGSADGILHCYSNFTGKLWRTMKTGFDVCLDASFHPMLPSTVACCSSKGQVKIFH